MSLLLQSLLLALGFITALVLTGILTLGRDLFPDVPNERSMHTRVIPRGGGVAIATVFCFAIGVGFFAQPGAVSATMVALLCGSLAVTGLGLLDDRYQLPILTRLLAQLIICSIVAYLGSDDRLQLSGVLLIEGWPVFLLQVVWLVGCVNFFNFMDGIDGFAAGMAAALALLFSACFHLDLGAADHRELYTLMRFAYLALGAGTLGFLLWNLPPARIFLGDSGSYFLGFALSFPVIALPAAPARDFASYAFQFFPDSSAVFDQWTGVMLCIPFLLDPALTMLRRLRAGGSPWQAHRDHLYQLLYRSGWPALGVLGFYLSALLLCVIPALLQRFQAMPYGPMVSALLILTALCLLWFSLSRRLLLRLQPR